MFWKDLFCFRLMGYTNNLVARKIKNCAIFAKWPMKNWEYDVNLDLSADPMCKGVKLAQVLQSLGLNRKEHRGTVL